MNPPALPQPPDPMTLAALQSYVAEIVRARGFTTDGREVFVLLVEEVGELARELRHRRRHPARFDPENLAHECADVLLYLLDVANGLGVNLGPLWDGHQRENDRAFADGRKGQKPGPPPPPDATLNQLAGRAQQEGGERGGERGGGEGEEILLLLLLEAVGEIATELRKSWRGKAEPAGAGGKILQALHYLFRITNRLGTDLERAVREKERQNAARQWSY